jgi:16S rRNA A1518/A1519 N6-dimethyltransferase RsmA/KsgA/DIM1 with predicted DNA glycosylase/AP lyase activity
MSVIVDPEGNETRALFTLAELANKGILEIGSGEGRLTYRYAERASRVTAIEPFKPHFARAARSLPPDLKNLVRFHNLSFEDFSAASASSSFDIAILSWSL